MQFFKQKYTPELFIAFKNAYFCCFIIGFARFPPKGFITLTIRIIFSFAWFILLLETTGGTCQVRTLAFYFGYNMGLSLVHTSHRLQQLSQRARQLQIIGTFSTFTATDCDSRQSQQIHSQSEQAFNQPKPQTQKSMPKLRHRKFIFFNKIKINSKGIATVLPIA